MHLLEHQIIFQQTQNLGRGKKIATISLFHHRTPHCLHASLFVTFIVGYNLQYVRHVLHQFDFHITLILCFVIHTSRKGQKCNIHPEDVSNDFKALNSNVHFGVVLGHNHHT